MDQVGAISESRPKRCIALVVALFIVQPESMVGNRTIHCAAKPCIRYFCPKNRKMKVEQLHGPTIKPFQVIELERLLQADSPNLFCPYGLKRGGQVIVTHAPARLDIMGGIADYCGATVFEMTLNRTAVVACQAREDKKICAVTLGVATQLKPGFQVSLDDFYTDGMLKSYQQIRELFNKQPQTAWAGYVLGGFYVLLKEGFASYTLSDSQACPREEGACENVAPQADSIANPALQKKQFTHGAAIVLKSDIPMRAGIASSAAIEVAALTAINQLYDLELGVMEIARLAQIVENRIIGAPCGIMDQVTAAAGSWTKMLSILCQPDKILEFVPRPLQVSFVGIHTKAPRSTTSTAYIDTRTAAFMGLTILKKELGWQKLNDNYLCNLTLGEFEEKCSPLLPEQMRGEDFLEKYGETVDTVTEVQREKIYEVRSRVEHPIYENARVKQFIAAIKNANRYPERVRDYLKEVGNLMYESNASYRDLAGLGSPEVDGIVNIAQKIGELGGIYGAKITGGGGGGTVALLCYGNVSRSLTQLLAAYKLAWGIDAETFSGSAPGACEFGHLLWELKESEPLTHF